MAEVQPSTSSISPPKAEPAPEAPPSTTAADEHTKEGDHATPEKDAALEAMQKQAEASLAIEIPVPEKHTFRIILRSINLRNVMPFDGTVSRCYLEFKFGTPRPKTREYAFWLLVG